MNVGKMLMMRCGGLVWRNCYDYSQPSCNYTNPQSVEQRTHNRPKRPLQPKHVWAIRVRLELAESTCELALFNLAIDSKLQGSDLVRLMASDVYVAGCVKERTSILQSKTKQPVQFEITEGTRNSLTAWIGDSAMVGSDFLWPGRFHESDHISTRQYARLLKGWVAFIGVELEDALAISESVEI